MTFNINDKRAVAKIDKGQGIKYRFQPGAHIVTLYGPGNILLEGPFRGQVGNAYFEEGVLFGKKKVSNQSMPEVCNNLENLPREKKLTASFFHTQVTQRTIDYPTTDNERCCPWFC